TAQTVVEALDHDELPFELLVQELRREMGASHAPIVQIGFAMQNMPMPRIELPGVRVEPLEIDSGAARADLVLFATDRVDGIRLSIEYSSDLFNAPTIDALLVEIESILAGGIGVDVDSVVERDVAALADDEVDTLLRQLVERS